jgi:hypothetical protein
MTTMSDIQGYRVIAVTGVHRTNGTSTLRRPSNAGASDSDIEAICQMLAPTVANIAAEVARRAKGHWIDEVPQGDGLSTGAAGTIAEISNQTLRTWAEECAVQPGKAIGLRVVTGGDRGDGWVLSWTRLIEEIEYRKGKPRRVEVEQRYKKFVSNLADARK